VIAVGRWSIWQVFCFVHQQYSLVCEPHLFWNGCIKTKGQRVIPVKRLASLPKHELMDQERADRQFVI
jgi:hypothetical protein